jgi:hypothetical protein
VWSREDLLDNLAGDLEYPPRRAAVYLVVGAAALAFWIFSPHEAQFTTTPLVFALGSLPLPTKGVFLLRRSSEGIGLTDSDMAELTESARRKRLPSLPSQAAQVLQDLGAGGLLLWPLLNIGKDFDQAWTNPPRVFVFLSGAVLFVVGWVVRKFCANG